MLQNQFKFLKIKQFASPNLPGSEIYMDTVFLSKLNSLAKAIPEGINITSGYYTTDDYDISSDKRDLAHLRGLAAHITCLDDHKRFLIIMLAIQRGIFRIGIGKTFIHLDIDYDLPADVIFLY